MKNTFILLPPSEGKIEGGENNFKNLNKNSEELIKFLQENISKEETTKLEKAFKVKDKNLDKALHLLNNIQNEKTLPAIKRFNGVMFKAINYDSMSKVQKNNFNNKVLFIDGLFGILKPQNLIPNYKLPIDAKINTIKIDKYWRGKLEKYFVEEFDNSLIIDILPNAHRKVLTIPSNCEYYKITFAELKNNKLKEAGHLSKKLKAELIQYLMNQENISKNDLLNFVHEEGYSFSEEFSKENQILYLKK